MQHPDNLAKESIFLLEGAAKAKVLKDAKSRKASTWGGLFDVSSSLIKFEIVPTELQIEVQT